VNYALIIHKNKKINVAKVQAAMAEISANYVGKIMPYGEDKSALLYYKRPEPIDIEKLLDSSTLVCHFPKIKYIDVCED